MICPAYDTFLSVGDITIHLVSEDRGLVSATEAALEAFLTQSRCADVEIAARWTETPDAAVADGGQVLFDAAGPWRLLRTANEFLFAFRSAVGDPAPYKTARFDPTFTRGDVQLSCRHFDHRSADTVNPLEYPLDELLMIHLLSRGRGVEIHGCGLLDRTGRAHVFAGQSGAGKSTLARLWLDRPGVTLLSDERVVLRTDRDRIVVYGTPWHGDAKLVSPQCGELASVFFLNHAAAHAVRPVSGSLAAARLLACSFLPFHSTGAIDKTLTALERITREIPCHDLWFAPEPSVTDVLTRHMG